MSIDVAICFGTYQRLGPLQACVASIRRAVGALNYEIIVADGGSVDGTQQWVAEQPDMVLIQQELPLTGAVIAFNLCFARSVEDGSDFVVQFNDDLVFADGLEIERAVEMMRTDESIGAVAFASDRYSPGKPACEWMRYHGKCYCNQGVFRREAGMAVARFLGDPEGKKWWDPRFHTYASDTVLGLCLWRLGWRVHEATNLCVHDSFMLDGGRLDPLRKHNFDRYTNGDVFLKDWADPHSADYNREDALRFGGRLL